MIDGSDAAPNVCEHPVLDASEFRVLFESLPGLYVVVRPDAPKFTVVAVSDAYLHATRRLRAELIGQGLLEVFAKGSDIRQIPTLDTVRASLERVTATGQAASTPPKRYDIPESASSIKTLEERYWTTSSTPVLTSDGAVRMIVHRVDDVTEAERHRRLAAEMARNRVDVKQMKRLTQERQLLALLAEHSHEFIGISDLQGVPVYVNPAGVALIGAHDLEEIQRTPVADYFVPEERPFVQDVALPDALSRGRWQGELHFQHFRTGEVIPVFYDVFRVDDPATGQPSHFATISRDLREHKRREQAIRNAEQEQARLHAALRAEHNRAVEVLESISDAFYAVDSEFRFTYVNRKTEELWGRRREELIGRHLWTEFPSAVGSESYHRHLRAMADRQPVRFEAISPLLGRWVDVSLYPAAGGGLSCYFQDITHRKHAEEDLRRYQQFFEHAAVGLSVGMPDGRFGVLNPAFAKMLGATAEELIGRPISDIFPPEELAGLEEARRKVQETGRHIWESVYVRKDGTRFPVAIDLNGVWDDQSRLLYRIASVTDISERKLAETALRQQLLLTEAITNNASVSLFITDANRRCVFINPAAQHLSGYSMDEVSGRTMHELVHHSRADGSPYPASECPILRAFDEGRQMQGEETFIHKDGHFYSVAYTASPIPAGAGVVGTIVEVQDITERKRMEKALRNSEERLQQVFAQAPVGVAVLRGPEMVFELANEQFQEFFPNRELVGQPLFEVAPEVSETLRGILRTVLTKGEPFIANEYSIPLDRNRDGIVEDCWFTFVYHPLTEHDGSVSGLVVVAVDVTSHVLARRGLERANRELEEFAYVSSHDLKEPLRMINAYTQLLLRRTPLGEDTEAQRAAGFIRNGVSRMEKLLADLLSYSRIVHHEQGDARPTDLNAVLREALAVMESRVEDMRAEVTHEPLPVILGDELQIAQVFQNLLSNALKYRNPEGRPRIHIAAKRDGDQWVLSVQDNGIGFDPQYAERIFGLFKRLHTEDYPGTGLGLAICQRIVERHGGRMWAESRLGEGATFYFTLPAAA